MCNTHANFKGKTSFSKFQRWVLTTYSKIMKLYMKGYKPNPVSEEWLTLGRKGEGGALHRSLTFCFFKKKELCETNVARC